MASQDTWQTEFYQKFAQKSPQIIPFFKYLYFVILLFMLIGAWTYLKNSRVDQFFYTIGVYFGRTAVLLLGIVVLPGILGRLAIDIKITRIITLFRRQLGILVFVLAFCHYQLVRGISIYTGQIPLSPRPIFEVMGTSALFLLFLLFLTSNNFSVKKLGSWWKRLHRLIYIAVWILVLHTGLQRISIWSLFIGIFAFFEIISLISDYFRRRLTSTRS